MFEYLQMSDELEAIPIWVANNGVAHQVPFPDLLPYPSFPLPGCSSASQPCAASWGCLRRHVCSFQGHIRQASGGGA